MIEAGICGLVVGAFMPILAKYASVTWAVVYGITFIVGSLTLAIATSEGELFAFANVAFAIGFWLSQWRVEHGRTSVS